MAAAKQQARTTATFEPYFWEAYNQIVQPLRFRWYLDTKWMPTLKPLGYAIVCQLRSRCYFNPKTGECRNQTEVDMDELAASIGVHRTTLWREFRENNALACFVTKQEQYIQVSTTRTQRASNYYFVAMDDPIHPDDMAEYERLKAEREGRRTSSPPAKVIHRLQNATNGATHGLQNATDDVQNATHNPYSSLLSSIPIHTSDTAAFAPKPNGCPPEGEGETVAPLACAWHEALRVLAGLVNKPTFEAHIRTLRPVERVGDTVTLFCPSAFTREWILKRHETHLVEALSAALGTAVAVQLNHSE